MRATAGPASATSLSGGGTREARFVPYEPYPGCVSPLSAPGPVSPPADPGPRRVSGDSSGAASSAVAAAAVVAAAAAAAAAPEEEDVRITKLKREKDELQRELNIAMEVGAT